MAKQVVEVGQIVYVEDLETFWGTVTKNEGLEEYIVTKANGSSFYCVRRNRINGVEYRFSNKTMTNDSSFGGRMIAYLDPDEYYDAIEKKKKREKLVKLAHDAVDKMNIAELENLIQFVESEKKKGE